PRLRAPWPGRCDLAPSPSTSYPSLVANAQRSGRTRQAGGCPFYRARVLAAGNRSAVMCVDSFSAAAGYGDAVRGEAPTPRVGAGETETSLKSLGWSSHRSYL